MKKNCTQAAPETAEWSYFFYVEQLENKPVKIKIEAGKEDLKRLARRLDVMAVDNVKADLELKRNNVMIIVRGRLSADVTQSCVVTLQPVHSHLEDDFDAYYTQKEDVISFARARQEKDLEKMQGETPMLEEYEDPEPILDGKIDLAELVTQYLSLSINPYPHAQGVEFDKSEEAEIIAQKRAEDDKNPFAALKNWRKRLDEE